MLNHGWRMQRWLPVTLAMLLALPPGMSGQAPTPPPQIAAVQPATIRDLKIIALAGSQAMNDLERKVMAPLVVQVLDQSDQPVEGADVTFRFPLAGPSASFPDQKNVNTVRTNADGQAAALGWMANDHVGTFQVQVTATRGNEQGSAMISMTNVTRITDQEKSGHKKWWTTKWGKIAIVAGAAGVAAIIFVAVHSSSSGPRVITATPGSPTIGGPQ
jgi:hypothetical protein